MSLVGAPSTVSGLTKCSWGAGGPLGLERGDHVWFSGALNSESSLALPCTGVTKHITGLLGPSGPAIDFLRDLDLDSTEETRLWHNGEPGICHLDFVSLGGARERME